MPRRGAPSIEETLTGKIPETTPSAGEPIGGEVGPISGRYELRRHLQDGGSASVYEGYDKHLMRQVAVKRYVADEGDSATLARFWREARLTGWLAHPNIVPVHDVLPRDDGGCDLIMKLVEGKTLSARIASHSPRQDTADALEQHLRDLLKVCDALAFAHARGVVHRDLKPSNIMVGEHGEVYVMDWGVAKVLPGGGPAMAEPASGSYALSGTELADLTLPPGAEVDASHQPHTTFRGALVGTPVYMSPEQASGNADSAGIEVDIFGLGALLYEILTGRAPYEGQTLPQILESAKARRLVAPEERAPERTVSPELSRICLKAMAKNPKDRYPRVANFALELVDVLRGGGWFETKHYAAGQVIVAEKEPSDRAFVLNKGRCRVSKGAGDSEQELRIMQPGEVFGEVGLITGEPRSATITAIEPVEVQVISSQGLKYELEHHGLIGKFLKSLALRFLDVDEKLFEARRQRDE